MRLSGEFQACLLFYEKISSVKEVPKHKTNDFHPLRSFCARKKLLPFLLFAYFCLICVFCVQNFFVKKNKQA